MTTDILSKISELPPELNRLVFAYIPNRLPFKEELMEKMKNEWYECCQYLTLCEYFPFRKIKIYSFKATIMGREEDFGTLETSQKIKFPNTNRTLFIYKCLKYAFKKQLKLIAKKNQIKGRSKLKTHNDFISSFLKNDVF